jgi:hypothetical protein
MKPPVTAPENVLVFWRFVPGDAVQASFTVVTGENCTTEEATATHGDDRPSPHADR